jgi:hypothetical protein
MRPNIQITGFWSDGKRVKPGRAARKGPKPVLRTPLSDSTARRETPTVLNPSIRSAIPRRQIALSAGAVSVSGLAQVVYPIAVL